MINKDGGTQLLWGGIELMGGPPVPQLGKTLRSMGNSNQ